MRFIQLVDEQSGDTIYIDLMSITHMKTSNTFKRFDIFNESELIARIYGFDRDKQMQLLQDWQNARRGEQ